MRRALLALVLLGAPAAAQAQQSSISQFPSAASFSDSDLFLATQGYTVPGTGATRKVSGSILRSWIAVNQSTILDSLLGTTRGSVPYRGASAWAGLTPGAANSILISNGSGADPSYSTATALMDAVFGSARGSILVRGASAWEVLAPGTSGYRLTSGGAGADLSWSPGASGSVTSVTFTGDGTVLSSTPSSAVTTSGTVAASLNTQTANHVLAGPTSGGAAAPTFRALVAGDLPAGIGTLTSLATGAGLTGGTITSTGTVAATTNTLTTGIEFIIDGGGSAITTGSKGFIEIPYACTITAARIVADQTGSIVVDIKKATYSGLFTTASITASAKPTLSSAQKNQDTTLTGWTTSVSAGDWLEYNVDSSTTVQRVTVSLTCAKS